MRPIKLTMSAFGSYSGMETIDFTKIQGGLFLVTGDTGAGKTTITNLLNRFYDIQDGKIRYDGITTGQAADGATEI